MNIFQIFFTDCETQYEGFIMQTDGSAIILALKKDAEYDKLVNEGKIPR